MVNCVKPPLYTWDLEESDDGDSENEAGQRLLLRFQGLLGGPETSRKL